jgi:hypothetical protein
MEGWLPLATGLGGIALGGVLGWVGKAIEQRRSWDLEKKRDRLYREREALSKALAWIDPMTLAYSRASFLSLQYIMHRFDDDHFRERYPSNLGAQLEALEVPMDMRIFLPKGVQERGVRILSRLGNLYLEALAQRGRDPKDVFEAVFRLTQEVEGEINTLRTELTDALLSTYE